MLPPLKIAIPAGTKSITATALSLSKHPVTVSISWSSGSAQFGIDFKGPNENYQLQEKVFGVPVGTINPDVEDLTVFIKYEGETMASQHAVVGPATTKVGPQGSSQMVQILSFAPGEEAKTRSAPAVITLLFGGTLQGLKK